MCEFLDIYLVDRLVTGVAVLPRLFGRDVLAPLSERLIQFYAAVSALSVAVLALDSACCSEYRSLAGESDED